MQWSQSLEKLLASQSKYFTLVLLFSYSADKNLSNFTKYAKLQHPANTDKE